MQSARGSVRPQDRRRPVHPRSCVGGGWPVDRPPEPIWGIAVEPAVMPCPVPGHGAEKRF
jgi:hypothetical protein